MNGVELRHSLVQSARHLADLLDRPNPENDTWSIQVAEEAKRISDWWAAMQVENPPKDNTIGG